MSDYNYAEFSTGDYNLDQFFGPRLGTKAPDFTLENANGHKVNLLDFKGDFLVLEMGSITCPLFQGRRETMSGLIEKHPHVDFSVLYVREAHPGKNIGAHQNIDDKKECANRLVNDGERRRVLVDDFEGTVHGAYGSYPNAVFIINKNGCIVFRAYWNNPDATGRALSQLLAGKPANVKSYFRPVRPDIAIKTLRDGGKGSVVDFFKGLPFLIWKNLIRRNFLLAFNREPQIRPDIKC
ncbi:deiodinase-like protein [uncultured Maritalea sp.]|uniref:deiodinase-like protein n=1 Tax=uncultured Maritalea sp. TaxID=757249 RepID=UPI00262FFD08|nr:deiodinase-like protein [uncultured Maritalea sp.]